MRLLLIALALAACSQHVDTGTRFDCPGGTAAIDGPGFGCYLQRTGQLDD